MQVEMAQIVFQINQEIHIVGLKICGNYLKGLAAACLLMPSWALGAVSFLGQKVTPLCIGCESVLTERVYKAWSLDEAAQHCRGVVSALGSTSDCTSYKVNAQGNYELYDQSVRLDTGMPLGLQYKIKTFCQPPSKKQVFITSNNNYDFKCVLTCPKGTSYNPVEKRCEILDPQLNCQTVTKNPIALATGEKRRRENIVTVTPDFTFRFFYNSFTGLQPTPGLDAISAISDPNNETNFPVYDEASYTAQFNALGLPKTANDPAFAPLYGARYWRSSFDEFLTFKAGHWIWSSPSDGDIRFDTSGRGINNPETTLKIESTNPADGIKWRIFHHGSERAFDSIGRLKHIKFQSGQSVVLGYDATNNLTTARFSNGRLLEFSYVEFPASSTYTIAEKVYLLSSINSNFGERQQITWSAPIKWVSDEYRLLEKVDFYTPSGWVSARIFRYEKPSNPTLLTSIHDSDGNNSRQYAKFEYDDQARAVYSALSGGADAIRVSYPDDWTRIITNIQGKQSIYKFFEQNGTKRLSTVSGEPTSTCLRSTTEYQYDTAGNIQSQTINGVTSRFEYDNQNREVSRTEAFGTPLASTTQTCWHATLNKPVRIIEPKQIIDYSYSAQGQITQMKRRPRTDNTTACANVL